MSQPARKVPTVTNLVEICQSFINSSINEAKFRRIFGNALVIFFDALPPNDHRAMIVRAGIPSSFTLQGKFPDFIWNAGAIAQGFILHMKAAMPSAISPPTPPRSSDRLRRPLSPPQVVTAEAQDFLGLTANDDPHHIRECIQTMRGRIGSVGVKESRELEKVVKYYESLLVASSTRRTSPTRTEPKTFYSLLKERLTVESRRIDQLTRQAHVDLSQQGLAENNVKAICKWLQQQQADDRLASLYLIDSICRMVRGRYITLFQPEIRAIVVATFKYGGSKIRKKIMKIVKTWQKKQVFPEHELTAIDQDITVLDNQPTYAPKQPPPPSRPKPSVPYNRASHNHSRAPQNTRVGGQVDVAAILKKFDEEVDTRPELRPKLAEMVTKVLQGRDVTQDILDFWQKLSVTPRVDKQGVDSLWASMQSIQAGKSGKLNGQTGKPMKPKPVCKAFNSVDGCMNVNCLLRHVKIVKPKVPTLSRNSIITDSRGEVTFWTLYDEKTMKKLKKHSINLLYSKKLDVCPICGIRTAKAKLDEHMDWHFAEHEHLKLFANKAKYRTWYLSHTDWCEDVDLSEKARNPFWEVEDEEQKVDNRKVAADDTHTTCAVCKEPFDTIFSDELDEWMYNGAVYDDGTTTKASGPLTKAILHVKCYEDLAEEKRRNVVKEKREREAREFAEMKAAPKQHIPAHPRVVKKRKVKKKHVKKYNKAPPMVKLLPETDVFRSWKPSKPISTSIVPTKPVKPKPSKGDANVLKKSSAASNEKTSDTIVRKRPLPTTEQRDEGSALPRKKVKVKDEEDKKKDKHEVVDLASDDILLIKEEDDLDIELSLPSPSSVKDEGDLSPTEMTPEPNSSPPPPGVLKPPPPPIDLIEPSPPPPEPKKAMMPIKPPLPLPEGIPVTTAADLIAIQAMDDPISEGEGQGQEKPEVIDVEEIESEQEESSSDDGVEIILDETT